MTQAFNLSQLGNKVNSSGQIDTTALQSGTYPINISGNAATATSATNGGVTSVNGSTGAVTVPSIGVGQAWYDLTSSRTAGTIYTNTTGKPISVSIIFNCANSSGSTLYVDSIPVAQVQIAIYTANIYLNTIVPAGSTYNVIITGGFTVSTWAELR